MTDICERRSFVGRGRDASHCLSAFVAEHRLRDGKVHITLRLPLRMFARWKSPIVRRVIDLKNASGPAVSMFRARKTPREKAARMTQVNHRTTVPILALPYGIIRNWNQLDGRAVIREILTNRPRSCIISSRLRNRSAWATCHQTYANATPKRHSQPLDHASRVILEERKVRHRRRLFDSSGERASIASLNLSTTAICENLL
jgi:hypothetical protein